MIEFRSENFTLPLFGGVTLNLKSPLFNTDRFSGTYSFPFKVPAFNFGFKPSAMNQTQSFDGELFDGIKLFQGKLDVMDSNSSVFNCYFKSGASEIASMIKDKNLDDLNLGSIEFASEEEMLVYFNNTTNASYPDTDFCLPTLFDESLFELDDNLEHSTIAEPRWINFVYNQSYAMDQLLGKIHFLSPMLYVPALLKKVFAAIGYTLIDQVFEGNADLSRMVYFNLHNVSAQQKPRISINYSDLVQNYSIASFIKDIENLLAARFIVNQKEKIINFVFINEFFKLKYEPLIIQHGTPIIKNSPRAIVLKQNKDGADSYDGYANVYESNDWPELIGSLPSYTDLPSPIDYINKYAYIHDRDRYYKAGYYQGNLGWWEADEMWMFGLPPQYIFNHFKLGIGENISIETNMNFMVWEPGESICYTGYKYSDRKTIKPRFLFKGGWAFNNNHVNYDIDYYCCESFNSYGKYNFFYPQDRTLILDHWRVFAEFLNNTKLLKVTIILTKKQLTDFNWMQSIMIDNTPVLPDEIQATITSSGDILFTMQGYTL